MSWASEVLKYFSNYKATREIEDYAENHPEEIENERVNKQDKIKEDEELFKLSRRAIATGEHRDLHKYLEARRNRL